MSRYLSALKISENTLTPNLQNLQNPPFASSVGFVGSSPATFQIKKAENGTVVDVDNAVHFRWLIHYPGRDPVTRSFSTMVSHGEAMASSQGAVAAVPAGKESMRRIPNPDEAEQLRKLVQYVYQNDSEGDRNEALDAAMADVDLAMECYRAIVLERGLIPVIDDDRRTCRQCANLSYSSSCKVACPGGALSAQKGYRAGALWLENPHRCEAFHEKGKP